MFSQQAALPRPTWSPSAPSLLSRTDRLRYRVQRRGLALAMGTFMLVRHRTLLPKTRPSQLEVEVLRQSFEKLLARDMANVEDGHYPRELLFSMPLRRYLRALPQAFGDQPRMIRRAQENRYCDLPAEAQPERYPAYYRRNFHWQSDGWLSTDSARIYDVSVEFLFAGAADVMRRMALPPLFHHLRNRRHADTGAPGAGQAPPVPRVLDIACGTGRFLDMARRAFPGATYTGIDLSPYYVEYARQALAETSSGADDTALLCGNAESLPFADAHFDAVSSLFLFHELPKDVRRRVVREAFRTLRPGGRLVICDAAQQGDIADAQFFFDVFMSLYHEPYFKSYLRDDLGDLLRECGFIVDSEETFYLAKVVSARRRARRRARRPQ